MSEGAEQARPVCLGCRLSDASTRRISPGFRTLFVLTVEVSDQGKQRSKRTVGADVPEGDRRLKSVPPHVSDPGRLEPALPCKRPTCSNPVDLDKAGRPSDFCTKACQQTFHRERARAARQLRDALAVAKAYDVEGTSSAFEPQPAQDSAAGQPSTPAPRGAAVEAGPSVQILTSLLHELSMSLATLTQSPATSGTAQAAARLERARETAYRALAQLS